MHENWFIVGQADGKSSHSEFSAVTNLAIIHMTKFRIAWRTNKKKSHIFFFVVVLISFRWFGRCKSHPKIYMAMICHVKQAHSVSFERELVNGNIIERNEEKKKTNKTHRNIWKEMEKFIFSIQIYCVNNSEFFKMCVCMCVCVCYAQNVGECAHCARSLARSPLNTQFTNSGTFDMAHKY